MQNAACPLISQSEKRGASDPHLTIYGMHAPLLRRNGEIVFIGSERTGEKGELLLAAQIVDHQPRLL